MSRATAAADLARLFVQMDQVDNHSALRAKNQAGTLLALAQLNFKAIAEQVEQRRLLLPPDIIAAIKRIDLPGEGDAAFLGSRKMLARAKLGFEHIAEALDHSGISPAEHAALETELARLHSEYQLQQRTIAGLRIMLGAYSFGSFLKQSARRIAAGIAIVAAVGVTFIIARSLVNVGIKIADAFSSRPPPFAETVHPDAEAVPLIYIEPPAPITRIDPPAIRIERRIPSRDSKRTPQQRRPNRQPEPQGYWDYRPAWQSDRLPCRGGVGDCGWGGR